MRVLFFSEGNLGSFILGQAQLEATLRDGTAGVGGLETRFATLTPPGRLALAAAWKTTPFLERRHLDATMLRWHAMQSSRTWRAVGREIAAWHPDVLHVHSHSVALGLPRVMRTTPTVLSVDATISEWANMPAWREVNHVLPVEHRLVDAAERRALTSAALVQAWTPWAARTVLVAAPAARVVTHHPGLDLTQFLPGVRRERERKKVLFVGGRFLEKGGEDLIAALEPRLGHDVELDLVTPAEVPARRGVAVHRMSPGDPGFADLRQQADVFCLPTYGDAAPWAVLEAMASAVPVVATRVGGIADLVGPDAGLLVEPGDRAGLRLALDALLDDPSRRDATAAAARARVAAQFDAAQQAPALVRLLESARRRD